MTTASVARMVWGSPSVTPTTPTTPTAAVTPTAPTTTPTTNAATTPTQPSTGMLGFSTEMPTGYRQQDLGDGSYEVFNANNESMGVGFKSVQDALRERGFANAWRTTSNDNGVWTNPNLTIAQDIWRDVNGQEIDVSGLSHVQELVDSGPQDQFYRTNENGENEQVFVTRGTKQVNQQFNSEAEIRAAINGLLGQRNYNGVMGDWEALGQVLNGAISPQPQNWGNLPTNQRDEVISGTGMLYGSTPVYGSDGRIIGYRTDLTPNNDAQDFDNGTDTVNQEAFGTFITHAGKNHRWANSNWRELNDPESWRNNALMGDGGNAFIPVENLNNLSWTNRDSYQHQDIRKGIVQNVWENTHIDDDLGIVRYRDVAPAIEAAGNIIGVIFAYGIPIGSLAMAADGYTSGNSSAGNSALLRAGLSYAMSYTGGTTASGGEQAGQQAAANAAANEGLSTSAQVIQSVKDAASWFNNLKPADVGINFGNATLDRLAFGAAKSALSSAIRAGLSGQDLEETVKAAISSTVASLVGGTVGAATGSATGSNFAGQVAGQVAGSATGQAVGRELAGSTDSPSAPSSGSTSATTTTTQAPQSTTVQPLAGRVARMVWR